MNIGHVILSAWAMTIQLPMRRYCGKDFIGLPGLVGVIFIPLYTVFAHAPQVFYLWPVFLLSIVLNQAGSFQRRLRGVVQHSYFEGDPWLARTLLFSKDERKCRSSGEPFLSCMLGLFLMPVNQGLGLYFILGGIAMGLIQDIADRQFKRRVDEINNGRIENENLMRHVHQPQSRRRR
jgi:hypothetical protein